jgi:hypothetical protein
MPTQITLEYKGKTYVIHDEYEYDEYPPFMWENGNFSCDCNKSMFIQEVDEDFPELHCGAEIKMIDIKRI